MELANTVEPMNSVCFRDRFKAEYYQLQIRKEKLEKILRENPNGFQGGSPVPLLERQLGVMIEYMHILEERAYIENVEL